MTTDTDGEGMLRQIFFDARTHSFWQDRPIEDGLLAKVWEAARMAPTGANCQPARVVFVQSAEAKERLKPCLSPNNVPKTMAAPATAVVGYDLDFPDFLPRLYPQVDARSWYLGNEAKTQDTAARNGSLQAAYLILAARALGLDCGPMGGFDRDLVDAAFFAGRRVKSILLINLGYGDGSKLPPRNPRLSFDEACAVV